MLDTARADHRRHAEFGTEHASDRRADRIVVMTDELRQQNIEWRFLPPGCWYGIVAFVVVVLLAASC